ncbi:uncharacterized protein LOC111324498 isoform X2 [Stylophora pistillata]|uniref:uncharacterized protein LOC111324498 isoform X2 n=1 Tax=Stylophora pistillata TaxID=50429 RepID=UPI000C043258|nr:uncharacterized protein LOC111324498 isoform X2 [Stylophora pistillata]XP_022783808.1 uncharacterized protein LOC111324498 isoform X2 [Stylophora pistillata]
MIMWGLVAVVSYLLVYEGFGAIERHRKPGPDEIERVINVTHSSFWKCSMLQCPTGHGSTVPCATSVSISTPIMCVPCIGGVNFSDIDDYTPCKSCRNCDKNEERSGECTLESDTTVCLGTCYKGFYMDKISGGCHKCSACCGHDEKHHEKQCENSGLSRSMQCRQNHIECPKKHTKNNTDMDQHKRGLTGPTIVGIVVGLVFSFVVGVCVIIWCRRNRDSECMSSLTVYFHSSDTHPHNSEYCRGLSTGQMVQLQFKETTGGTLKSGKKPVYQRVKSVPVETRQEPVKKIPRSHSHPGALPKILNKKQGTSNLRKDPSPQIRSLRNKKWVKQGYIPVPTIQFPAFKEDEAIEHSSNPGPLIDPLPTPSQFGHNVEDIPQISLQSVDVRLQQPRLEKNSTSTSTTGLFNPTATVPQISDIPQEFLDYILSKKVTKIGIQFYSKICQTLDILRDIQGDDFRQLGEKVGIDKVAISWLKQRDYYQ